MWPVLQTLEDGGLHEVEIYGYFLVEEEEVMPWRLISAKQVRKTE